MKTSRKVFSISATMLALVTISTPVVSFAATASSPTGNATNVTQQVTDTATLMGGYLTIDGGTNLDFGTAPITSTGILMYADKNNTAADSWTTGTAGTLGTNNDQMSGNGLTTSTGLTFTAESAVFGKGANGVQVTDARGTNAGWTLYAYPSDLVNTTGNHLLGATIKIVTGGGFVYNTNEALDPVGTTNNTTGGTSTGGALR